MVSVAGPVQPEKALPMKTQLSALKTTEVSPLQLLKASLPMVDTAFPIVSDVSPPQLLKAWLSMVRTESGIVNAPFNPLQLLKALLPMVRTELGMVNTPDIWLSPEKALAGITLTLFPMVKDVTLLHPENDPIVQLSALNTMAEKLVQ